MKIKFGPFVDVELSSHRHETARIVIPQAGERQPPRHRLIVRFRDGHEAMIHEDRISLLPAH
jgi:hypothetical protein